MLEEVKREVLMQSENLCSTIRDVAIRSAGFYLTAEIFD